MIEYTSRNPSPVLMYCSLMALQTHAHAIVSYCFRLRSCSSHSSSSTTESAEASARPARPRSPPILPSSMNCARAPLLLPSASRYLFPGRAVGRRTAIRMQDSRVLLLSRRIQHIEQRDLLINHALLPVAVLCKEKGASDPLARVPLALYLLLRLLSPASPSSTSPAPPATPTPLGTPQSISSAFRRQQNTPKRPPSREQCTTRLLPILPSRTPIP